MWHRSCLRRRQLARALLQGAGEAADRVPGRNPTQRHDYVHAFAAGDHRHALEADVTQPIAHLMRSGNDRAETELFVGVEIENQAMIELEESTIARLADAAR